MKLTNLGLLDKLAWNKQGYDVFDYNREKLIRNTTKHPQWIHFGAGNIVRSFPANLAQKLIESKALQTGIIVAEGYDMEILDKVYTPFDNLCILATLQSDGEIKKTIIGSITESLYLDLSHSDYDRLQQIFIAPSLQLATFTITEKGYQLYDSQNLPFPIVQKDFMAGPKHAESYIAKITALLYARYCAGKFPIAMVSLDNCSHNGEKLCSAVMEFVQAWYDFKFVEKGFVSYIEDTRKVSFPITMIDKITPRPSDVIIQTLNKDGVENMNPVKTKKGTFVAPFVNAESSEYLVIEDEFPNGRPGLEKVGVHFCKKSVVDQVERMKVCTCLNPLHTTLAIFGCLFQYKTIYDCMQDVYLKSLVEGIGYVEGLPVVSDPKIICPKSFIDEVIQQRLVNPFMPDTPQRIATDTSIKLGIRFVETIKAYQKDRNLDVHSLQFIPFVFAGWCRYLMGVDDQGTKFICSDDPALLWLRECLKGVEIGKAIDVHDVLKPILSNLQVFKVDLYKINMAEKVEFYFAQMIKGKGAVKKAVENLFI